MENNPPNRELVIETDGCSSRATQENEHNAIDAASAVLGAEAGDAYDAFQKVSVITGGDGKINFEEPEDETPENIRLVNLWIEAEGAADEAFFGKAGRSTTDYADIYLRMEQA